MLDIEPGRFLLFIMYNDLILIFKKMNLVAHVLF